MFAVVALFAGSVIGYVFGSNNAYQSGYDGGYDGGYDVGYAKAEEDVKKIQAEAAKLASEQAADAANPFQIENPLEGIDANPFEKTKKVLNPFE